MNCRFRGWWRYAVTVVAVASLVWYVGPSDLIETFREIDTRWFLLYLCAYLIVPVLYGLQILGMLRIAGYSIRTPGTIGAAMHAWSFGTLTPMRAGDLSLAYFLRGHVPETDAIALVSIDKVLSLTVLSLMALVGTAGLSLPYGDALAVGAAMTIGGTVAIVAGISLRGTDTHVRALARRWVGASAEDAWQRIQFLSRSPRLLVWCVTMASARWLYICSINIVIFRAVAELPEFRYVVAATSVGRIISLVPVSIGGVGIKEPAQILIYRMTGVSSEAVLAVSVLGFVSGLLIAAVIPHVTALLVRERTKEV